MTILPVFEYLPDERRHDPQEKIHVIRDIDLAADHDSFLSSRRLSTVTRTVFNPKHLPTPECEPHSNSGR
jgi:hypothetical protein